MLLRLGAVPLVEVAARQAQVDVTQGRLATAVGALFEDTAGDLEVASGLPALVEGKRVLQRIPSDLRRT